MSGESYGSIACVGAGTVGRSWALAFARAGHAVRLWDAAPGAAAAAYDWVRAALGPDGGATLARITPCVDLAAALTDAAHVQESIAEQAEAKRALYTKLDVLADRGAVLASSTSALPASAFTEGLAGRARCLVAHPVNPPHLIRLVELCPAPWTDPAIVARTHALMTAIGQVPITLAREAPGFVLNRLQWAVLGEALHLVGEGYCSAADVDRAIVEGLAPRWAFYGPFMVGHLNAARGLQGYFDTLAEAIDRVRTTLRTDYPADAALIAAQHAILAADVPVSAIPAAQTMRDRRIAGLREHRATSQGED